MTILLIAEHDNATLSDQTAKALTAAKEIGGDVHVLVAGKDAKAAADAAGVPIYLELSSLNPVFVLPGSVRERGSAIASELAGSCNLGGGQFCTKPGLIVLEGGADSAGFISTMRQSFADAPEPVLLMADSASRIKESLEVLTAAGAEILAGGSPGTRAGFRFQPTLLKVSGTTFLKEATALQREAFGPVALLVVADDEKQMPAIASAMDGNLTATVYSDSAGTDDNLYQEITTIVRPRVGRLLNDKVPTGVAVVPSMQHGGPFPATGHPGFTSVGLPASICRFAALQCYDSVRPHRLPKALADANPNGRMWRLIDGEWTRADVSR